MFPGPLPSRSIGEGHAVIAARTTENVESDDSAGLGEQLSVALESAKSFSFLRLGDGELRYLLEMQQGEWQDAKYSTDNLSPSCEIATGTLGLEVGDYPRLLASYEQCDALDFYAWLPYNSSRLGQLRWNRRPDGLSLPEIKGHGIVNYWTGFAWGRYAARHRCLICGAEGALQEQLLADPEYRRIAAGFWPAGAEIFFLHPPDRGRRPSAHLDQLKAALAQSISRHNIDTVLICLGGPAKILCHELARECGVRAVDWGSMLRALTYSGTDGNSTWRSSHNPFFFRVPLNVYMPALERAFPEMSVAERTARAHGQLCLELQRHVFAATLPTDVHDPASFDDSPGNRQAFADSYCYYVRHVLPLTRGNPAARALVAEMDYWLLKKGIGWRGRIFRALVRLKGALGLSR